MTQPAVSDRDSEEPSSVEARLRRTIRFHRIFLCFLVVFALAGSLVFAWFQYGDFLFPWQRVKIQKGVPYGPQVRDIIKDFRYTSRPVFMRPDVAIELDFENRKWKMRNIHQFDHEGKVLLEEGKYGICGDLAAYTYQKIKPLFGERYAIEYLQVSESSYFNSSAGTHIVLRIRDLQAPLGANVYILDPSFRKYGKPELFDDYLPVAAKKELQFVQDRDPNQTFEVGGGPPILMNRKVLLSLYVLEENGRFDRDNFRFALVAAERYEYVYDPIFTIIKSNGQVRIEEAHHEIAKLLLPGSYHSMRELLNRLFFQLDRSLERPARDPQA